MWFRTLSIAKYREKEEGNETFSAIYLDETFVRMYALMKARLHRFNEPHVLVKCERHFDIVTKQHFLLLLLLLFSLELNKKTIYLKTISMREKAKLRNKKYFE